MDRAGRKEDWRDKAACLEEDPELFFPVGTGKAAMHQIETAKEVCRRCEVIDACLEWALENGTVGVWGGTSDEERENLKRHNARARKVTSAESQTQETPDATSSLGKTALQG